MEHIKYESVAIKKGQFFEWLTNTLELNGWVNVASNMTEEGWIYRSKGNDGKSDIIVNFRNGYDGHNNGYAFSSTYRKYIDIRMMVSYTPNETIGKNGTHVPALANGQFTRMMMGVGIDYMYPDLDLTVHYNCSKNRMIFLVTTEESTTFCMFGRPDKNYSKEYEDTGNMIFTTYNYRLDRVGSWGIADRPTTAFTPMNIIVNPIKNSFYGNKLLFSEIGFGSNLEGVKGKLEGIYYVSNTDKQGSVTSMTGDKYIDELGNEYTLFYHRPTESGNYPSAFTTGHIAICTRLAGDE